MTFGVPPASGMQPQIDALGRRVRARLDFADKIG